MKKIYLSLMVGLFFLPTILISQTFTLAGTVTRHNGDPVEGIEMTWGNTSVITDISGNYNLSNIPINNSSGLIASGTFDKFEELTVLDLVFYRHYILGLENLSIPQFIETDVNNSGSNSGLDYVSLRRLALQIEDGLNSNYKYCYGDVASSCNFNPVITASADTIILLDITALKRGDIAIGSDYMPAPPSAPSPILSITEADFQAGEDVQIEVLVEEFGEILGIQQTFEWDPSLLEFQSISGIGEFVADYNDLYLGAGKLPVLSTPLSVDPMGLEDGDVLYTINFKALANAPSSGQYLSVSEELIPTQMIWRNPVDLELFIVEGDYISIEAPIKIQDIITLEAFDVFPNPAQNSINVNALLSNAERIGLSMTNVLGQEIFYKKFEQKELNVEIDLGKNPSGMYFLSLQTEQGIRTISFLKK